MILRFALWEYAACLGNWATFEAQKSAYGPESLLDLVRGARLGIFRRMVKVRELVFQIRQLVSEFLLPSQRVISRI